MTDLAFADFSEQVLSLRIIEDYTELEKDMTRTSTNAMWEELKNDTW